MRLSRRSGCGEPAGSCRSSLAYPSSGARLVLAGAIASVIVSPGCDDPCEARAVSSLVHLQPNEAKRVCPPYLHWRYWDLPKGRCAEAPSAVYFGRDLHHDWVNRSLLVTFKEGVSDGEARGFLREYVRSIVITPTPDYARYERYKWYLVVLLPDAPWDRMEALLAIKKQALVFGVGDVNPETYLQMHLGRLDPPL